MSHTPVTVLKPLVPGLCSSLLLYWGRWVGQLGWCFTDVFVNYLIERKLFFLASNALGKICSLICPHAESLQRNLSDLQSFSVHNINLMDYFVNIFYQEYVCFSDTWHALQIPLNHKTATGLHPRMSHCSQTDHWWPELEIPMISNDILASIHLMNTWNHCSWKKLMKLSR